MSRKLYYKTKNGFGQSVEYYEAGHQIIDILDRFETAYGLCDEINLATKGIPYIPRDLLDNKHFDAVVPGSATVEYDGETRYVKALALEEVVGENDEFLRAQSNYFDLTILDHFISNLKNDAWCLKKERVDQINQHEIGERLLQAASMLINMSKFIQILAKEKL